MTGILVLVKYLFVYWLGLRLTRGFRGTHPSTHPPPPPSIHPSILVGGHPAGNPSTHPAGKVDGKPPIWVAGLHQHQTVLSVRGYAKPWAIIDGDSQSRRSPSPESARQGLRHRLEGR